MRASTFMLISAGVVLVDVPKDLSATGRLERLSLLAFGDAPMQGGVATFRKSRCRPRPLKWGTRYCTTLRASIFMMVGAGVILADVPKDLSATGSRGRLALLAFGNAPMQGGVATCTKIAMGFMLCQSAATPKHIKEHEQKSRGG